MVSKQRPFLVEEVLPLSDDAPGSTAMGRPTRVFEAVEPDTHAADGNRSVQIQDATSPDDVTAGVVGPLRSRSRSEFISCRLPGTCSRGRGLDPDLECRSVPPTDSRERTRRAIPSFGSRRWSDAARVSLVGRLGARCRSAPSLCKKRAPRETIDGRPERGGPEINPLGPISDPPLVRITMTP